MTDLSVLPLIPGQVGAAAAAEIVSSVAGRPAVIERAVCYPYYRFDAEARVRALFAGRQIGVTCLVDALRGFASTADNFDVGHVPVPTGSVMQPRLAPQAAERAASAYLRHTLSRKFRAIANFGVVPGTTSMVYRKFWLLRCDGRVTMVDSVNGSLHVLRQAA